MLIVPGEYSTIQSAIDNAYTGDTVLVSPGTYYENLIIQKSITLISQAVFDDLSDWVGYDDGYVVANQNIASTILNGSHDTNGENFQSVILIDTPPNGGCITPTIKGFTITGGGGTNIFIGYDDDFNRLNEYRGGGFLSNNAKPTFNYNYFVNNKAKNEIFEDSNENNDYDIGEEYEDINNNGQYDMAIPIKSGGGGSLDYWDNFEGILAGYSWGNSNDCDNNRNWLNLVHTTWGGNNAVYGNSFTTNNSLDNIDMSHSYFDVYNCSDENVGGVWVDVDEEVEVDFTNSDGDLCSITEDVWVSPDGEDELGRSTYVFKTITRALEVIAPDANNIITIHVSEGTFAPSTTSEIFPIIMISNVNLKGAGDEVTILDAESTSRVIELNDLDNVSVQDLTITGGNTLTNGVTSSGYSGGGMSLAGSGIIKNVIIRDNYSQYTAGGLYIGWDGQALFQNVQIINNEATYGGGVYIDSARPLFYKVLIADNYASNDGGGICIVYGGHPFIINASIVNNIAGGMGSTMFLFSWSNADLVNSIFWRTDYGWPAEITFYDDYDMPSETMVYFRYSNTNDYWNASPWSYAWVYYDENTIHTDPMFIDPENGDYRLQSGSPSINTGTAEIDESWWSLNDFYWNWGGEDEMLDLINIDFYDTAPDMGAFEYCPYEIDLCNVCNGDGWSCAPMGDVNQNYIFNVIDLIIIVDYILDPESNPFTEQQIDIADINVDGSVDLLDVVALIQSMFNLLGRSDELALSFDKITIHKLVNGLSIETPGFVALDIKLSHTPGFEYTVVNNALLAGGRTEAEHTHLIIADPESNILFETDDPFELENITALGINGETIKVNFISLPTEFVLTPAYPNPFNPTTTLSFAIPIDSEVILSIYNLQGREISSLINGNMEAGYHSIVWDANSYASGVYFVKMVAGEYISTQKLMLIK